MKVDLPSIIPTLRRLVVFVGLLEAGVLNCMSKEDGDNNLTYHVANVFVAVKSSPLEYKLHVVGRVTVVKCVSFFFVLNRPTEPSVYVMIIGECQLCKFY